MAIDQLLASVEEAAKALSIGRSQVFDGRWLFGYFVGDEGAGFRINL